MTSELTPSFTYMDRYHCLPQGLGRLLLLRKHCYRCELYRQPVKCIPRKLDCCGLVPFQLPEAELRDAVSELPAIVWVTVGLLATDGFALQVNASHATFA